MLTLKQLQLLSYRKHLDNLPDGKLLINTINSHSFNLTKRDRSFAGAIEQSDILLPDGVSIVISTLLLQHRRIERIPGADLFEYEMVKINKRGGRVFFLGSTPQNLQKITERAAREYPRVEVFSCSPPFKEQFSEEDNAVMVATINQVRPDVLFIGLSAPKQEKWAAQHISQLEVGHVCSIGAVFDFYAGNILRAPFWIQSLGLEWLFRLISEPRRMWRRYILGNPIFIWYVLKELWSKGG